MCDNITAISYINNMKGMQSVECDDLARDIWLFSKKETSEYQHVSFQGNKINHVHLMKTLSKNLNLICSIALQRNSFALILICLQVVSTSNLQNM